MNNYAEHQKLLGEIMLAVGSLPHVRIWTRSVGVARHIHTDQFISYGIKGETDIDGILLGGRRLAIEVKTGNAKLTKEQQVWRDMLVKFGALYIEARSTEQVLAEIKSAL